MMVLLDTHIVLVALGQSSIVLPPLMRSYLARPDNVFASVVTLWELAIKHRLGKLGLSVRPADLPELLENLNIQVLPVQAVHALIEIGPEPRTKDPFDRLLLGVCAAERLKLITIDRALADHPLVWRDNG